jgi:hypothetical protein
VRRVIPERYGLLKIDAIGIGLCAAASLAFYWVTVQPCLQRQSFAAEQRRELTSRQDKVVELNAAAARVQERLAGAQADLAAGPVQLESAAHINKRVAGLTQFFSDCELDVDDVQTGQVYNGVQYNLVPITVLGRGAYGLSVKFFHGLRTMFPDMGVARIELSRNPGKNAERGAFQFDLLWYAAPDRSAVVQNNAEGSTPKTVLEN